MSKTDKLKKKFKNGSISASELRTLMSKLGWILDRTKGSHEQWRGPEGEKLTIATHSKTLMKYLIKEAQEKVK